MEDRIALVDSTLIISHLRKTRLHGQLSLLENARKTLDALFISAISIYEVEVGAKLAGRESDITPFLTYLAILDVTESVAREAALIHVELKRKNRLVDNRDILIAATGRVYRMPLLTQNISHFKYIQGIQCSSTLAAL